MAGRKGDSERARKVFGRIELEARCIGRGTMLFGPGAKIFFSHSTSPFFLGALWLYFALGGHPALIFYSHIQRLNEKDGRKVGYIQNARRRSGPSSSVKVTNSFSVFSKTIRSSSIFFNDLESSRFTPLFWVNGVRTSSLAV